MLSFVGEMRKCVNRERNIEEMTQQIHLLDLSRPAHNLSRQMPMTLVGLLGKLGLFDTCMFEGRQFLNLWASNAKF